MRVLVLFSLAASSLFAADVSIENAIGENAVGKIPLRFERDSSRSWTARSLGFTVSVGSDSAFVGLGKEGLRVQFVDSDKNAEFRGEKKSKTPNTYFVRGDSFTLDAYLQLRRANIYPGIDVVYYGAGQNLEYDFELSPGADLSQIRMRFDGAENAHIAEDGSLTLKLAKGEVTQKAPVTYQRLESGEIVSVPSRYREESGGIFSLKLDAYDETRPLVVDPQMLFALYLQGSGSEGPLSVNLDRDGIVYIAGFTYSSNFPLVCGCAYTDVLTTTEQITFTTKINPLATSDAIIYSGFFGGMFGDIPRAATVDQDGVFYLTGIVDDVLFPTTPNAHTRTNGETRRIFLSTIDTKIAGTDSLTYSTFFGGTDAGTEEPTAIALGPAKGLVALTGFTTKTNFPEKNSLTNGLVGAMDGFIALFDLTQSGEDSLIASTYFGGTDYDVPRSITFDTAGKLYVAGYTYSSNFPITPNANQPGYGGGSDAFLTKVDMRGAVIEYSTFLGGSGIDQAWDVVLDAQGQVALTGTTLSNSFPVTSSAFQTTPRGDGDAFLTIMNLQSAPGQAIQYSTLYGGSGADVALHLRIGPLGKYYLGGYTLSRNLRTVDALYPISAGAGTDGFVAIIDPGTLGINGLVYSSYVTGPGFQTVDGIEVDSAGNVYVVGQALGDVIGPADPDSNTNVFFFVFRPTDLAPASRKRGSVRTIHTRSRY